MFAPWKKSYEKLRQHIKKQRHYFANQGPSSQSCGFSSSLVGMWELGHKEGWEPNNWCFWTLLLKKTLESPLDSKEIKPVNPKGLMMELKLQYFAHLMWRANSLEKTLGKVEGRRRRGWKRMRWLDGFTDIMNLNLSKLPEMMKDREAWHAALHGVRKSWTWLSNWTTTSQVI